MNDTTVQFNQQQLYQRRCDMKSYDELKAKIESNSATNDLSKEE